MRRPGRAGDEAGQISLLVLGFCVVALTLIIGSAAVTSVQVSRMRLLDAADTAALDAADDEVAALYEGGVGTELPLTDRSVQEAAERTLDGRPLPHGLASWTVVEGTGTPDGRTAVVRLAGKARLPLIGGLLDGLGGSVTVTVESRSRAVVAGEG